MRVGLEVAGRDALAGVGHEDQTDDLHQLAGEPRGKGVISILYFLEEIYDGLFVEGQEARQEHVEDDAHRPHVGLLAVIALIRQHFRGHIIWCATSGVQ